MKEPKSVKNVGILNSKLVRSILTDIQVNILPVERIDKDGYSYQRKPLNGYIFRYTFSKTKDNLVVYRLSRGFMSQVQARHKVKELLKRLGKRAANWLIGDIAPNSKNVYTIMDKEEVVSDIREKYFLNLIFPQATKDVLNRVAEVIQEQTENLKFSNRCIDIREELSNSGKHTPTRKKPKVNKSVYPFVAEHINETYNRHTWYDNRSTTIYKRVPKQLPIVYFGAQEQSHTKTRLNLYYKNGEHTVFTTDNIVEELHELEGVNLFAFLLDIPSDVVYIEMEIINPIYYLPHADSGYRAMGYSVVVYGDRSNYLTK